jgi:hypothetical protein
VSAKLTPQICINNAASNSRLTQWAGKPQPQIPFSKLSPDSFFSSLPTFDEKTTKLHLHAEKLTETVLHLNLGHFVGFFFVCFVLCSFVLFYFFPLMRQLQNNI